MFRGEYNNITMMIMGEVVESDFNLQKLFDELKLYSVVKQCEEDSNVKVKDLKE